MLMSDNIAPADDAAPGFNRETTPGENPGFFRRNHNKSGIGAHTNKRPFVLPPAYTATARRFKDRF